jgi:hypothetical protein
MMRLRLRVRLCAGFSVDVAGLSLVSAIGTRGRCLAILGWWILPVVPWLQLLVRLVFGSYQSHSNQVQGFPALALVQAGVVSRNDSGIPALVFSNV